MVVLIKVFLSGNAQDTPHHKVNCQVPRDYPETYSWVEHITLQKMLGHKLLKARPRTCAAHQSPVP